MALLKAQRGAQVPLVATFEWNLADTMLNTDGTTTNSFNVAAKVVEVVTLPPNSVITGGELIVETAYDTTGTATVSVGDSSSAARYLGATSVKSAARTALVPTGFKNAGGLGIRLTFALADTAATVGKARVNVQYVIMDRANENV